LAVTRGPQKTVLWIDDSRAELQQGLAMLAQIDGLSGRGAGSSEDAKEILERYPVDAIVTDILRRHPNGTPSQDDGYEFVQGFVRSHFPDMPVVFHTKNAPASFELDSRSQYLAKWELPAKKAVELEVRLAEATALHEFYADWATWKQIEPRLVQVQSNILDDLNQVDDIWRLTADEFERMVGEVLQRTGWNILWVPGGKDGGIDIVASSHERDFLIDVKRYRSERPVTVELVRRVYGVAESVGLSRLDRITYGGIITSSYFTSDAQEFRRTLRRRPLLCDANWLTEQLKLHAPRIGARIAPTRGDPCNPKE
jgi:hypothetical protein